MSRINEKTLRVIGIGPGGPRQITLEAVDAIAATDVFLILDKGDRTAELTAARTRMLDEHARADHRVVVVPDPPRDRDPVDYEAEVRRWHSARVDAIGAALDENLAEGGSAAILVWGDPALYDSTLRITDRLVEQRDDLTVEVIPGVTSASALTAAHGIVAHGVGEPITTTTGRRLATTPDGADLNQIVMLDSALAFRETASPDDVVYWAAYVGTDDQILVSGRVGDVTDEIVAKRAEARERLGWIMDIYLLRKHG
ncbi:precorrin-6A synthase (deacetylating) [Gordonia malaquae]|uniref:Precorrin-6A synthase n=1 Tax=Gordonia malaquae NBRC 108250 TaxID=1223542 RepID=M3UKR3_GORML|nr:precorrin-6A synthase (deacetylating) [Gordonia malaquae]GAC80210.1 precorrin-6A synthase [Gordonia malaquae NBRC 108250]SEB92559.1 precorrin-6A synthase (deacetylating) [Gordonia malaquae]